MRRELEHDEGGGGREEIGGRREEIGGRREEGGGGLKEVTRSCKVVR